MTCLPRWFKSACAIVTAAVADDGGGELARDNFGLLPWTSAADRVRCRRMPPRCREHLMPGFTQIIRPRTSAAVSAPGNQGRGRLRLARDWAMADDSCRARRIMDEARA